MWTCHCANVDVKEQMCTKDQIQVVRLSGKSLYLLSHLTNPLPNTVEAKNARFKICSWDWQNGSADKVLVACKSNIPKFEPWNPCKDGKRNSSMKLSSDSQCWTCMPMHTALLKNGFPTTYWHFICTQLVHCLPWYTTSLVRKKWHWGYCGSTFL